MLAVKKKIAQCHFIGQPMLQKAASDKITALPHPLLPEADPNIRDYRGKLAKEYLNESRLSQSRKSLSFFRGAALTLPSSASAHNIRLVSHQEAAFMPLLMSVPARSVDRSIAEANNGAQSCECIECDV